LVELHVVISINDAPQSRYQIAPYLNFEGPKSDMAAARTAEQRLSSQGV
jgi:hypothetical protein